MEIKLINIKIIKIWKSLVVISRKKESLKELD